MKERGCPFCFPDRERVLFRELLATALFDAYPVSPGHLLVIPNDHEADFLKLPDETKHAMFALVDRCREHLEIHHSPDGINVGVNIGRAAGQTVMHAHIHVIPRHHGDVEEPRGGVRGVIPRRRDYP